MPGPGLKRLLETNQEYGFQREVDQAEVLGDFLSQVWPQNSPKDHENLTHFLSGDNQGTDNIITSGTDDSDLLKKTLNEYLKNTLLIKLDAFEKRILKKKEPENKLEAKDIKKISYHPLNHRFLTEPGIRLGSFLYSCLYKYVDKKRIEIIKKRLISLEHHQEAEEKIVSAIFKWPTESSETWQAKTPEADVPERSKDYKSLFEQFAEDLEALLQLDIKLMSKNRVLLYLERLINLYALLYYLRIICRYTDDKKGQDMDPPLILPLCSNEADDLFKDYSTRCFEVYRQKAVAFWREYLRERIVHNAEELKCINDNAAGILKNFTAYGSQIFGFSQTHDEKVKTPKKTIKKLEEEIKEILDDIKDIEMSNIERFTEAYLTYNLRRSRTLVRLRRVLDWQGVGAGLLAPEGANIKHFHLKPELLETLVIIFVSRHAMQPSHLSLRNFVSETISRYGIILGHAGEIELSVKKQGLPELKTDIFKKNNDNIITMLRNLNMLESLSDMDMFVKCPFPFLRDREGINE